VSIYITRNVEMLTLPKLIDNWLELITGYCEYQIKSPIVLPTDSDEQLYSSVLNVIDKATYNYSTRKTFLTYVLDVLMIIKPVVAKNQYLDEEEEALILHALSNLLYQSSILMNTTNDKKVAIEHRDSNIMMHGFIRGGWGKNFNGTRTTMGTFVHDKIMSLITTSPDVPLSTAYEYYLNITKTLIERYQVNLQHDARINAKIALLENKLSQSERRNDTLEIAVGQLTEQYQDLSKKYEALLIQLQSLSTRVNLTNMSAGFFARRPQDASGYLPSNLATSPDSPSSSP